MDCSCLSSLNQDLMNDSTRRGVFTTTDEFSTVVNQLNTIISSPPGESLADVAMSIKVLRLVATGGEKSQRKIFDDVYVTRLLKFIHLAVEEKVTQNEEILSFGLQLISNLETNNEEVGAELFPLVLEDPEILQDGLKRGDKYAKFVMVAVFKFVARNEDHLKILLSSENGKKLVRAILDHAHHIDHENQIAKKSDQDEQYFEWFYYLFQRIMSLESSAPLDFLDVAISDTVERSHKMFKLGDRSHEIPLLERTIVMNNLETKFCVPSDSLKRVLSLFSASVQRRIEMNSTCIVSALDDDQEMDKSNFFLSKRATRIFFDLFLTLGRYFVEEYSRDDFLEVTTKDMGKGHFKLLTHIVDSVHMLIRSFGQMTVNGKLTPGIQSAVVMGLYPTLNDILKQVRRVTIQRVASFAKNPQEVFDNIHLKKNVVRDRDEKDELFAGISTNILKIFSNTSEGSKEAQDFFNDVDRVFAVLNHTYLSEDDPYMQQYAIIIVRNICEGRPEIQAIIDKIRPVNMNVKEEEKGDQPTIEEEKSD